MGSLKSIQQKMDGYEVVLGFCEHGKALAMCYDMPGMKHDVRDIYQNYKRVERMSPADSRARFDGGCAECKTGL